MKILLGTALLLGAGFSYAVVNELNNASQPPTTIPPVAQQAITQPKLIQTESRPARSSNTFRGYSCTSDCSGHEAGYEYASENDICDFEYSNGRSSSFDEGVISYAEENCEPDYSEDYEEDYDYYR